jgi:hypothetical protein
MLKDAILNMIFVNPKMQTIPLGYQAVAVEVFTDVLEEIVKEKPNADIQSLFELYE